MIRPDSRNPRKQQEKVFIQSRVKTIEGDRAYLYPSKPPGTPSKDCFKWIPSGSLGLVLGKVPNRPYYMLIVEFKLEGETITVEMHRRLVSAAA